MITATAIAATNATSNPYSIRSSPRSSLRNRLTKFNIGNYPPSCGAGSTTPQVPACRATRSGAGTAGSVDRVLRLVQRVHRTLIGILDRGAEAERIGDDDRQGDRGHERDEEAVFHQVLTAL